jgi:hypothetical protein
MGKQPDKKLPTGRDKFFIFGIDETGKTRGARFADFNEKVATVARDLGLTSVHPASAAFTEAGMKLPEGRLYASGKAFVPPIKRELVEKLYAVLAVVGDDSQARPAAQETKGDRPALASGLPRDWPEIQVGQTVLATEDDAPEDGGYWACIVIKRDDDVLTLRLRDYPKQRQTYLRNIAQVALLFPGL